MRKLIALALALTFLAPAANAGLAIDHWKTRNGARVYFVHAPELPILDLQVVFDAGSVRDNGRGGLAALTARLLRSGAGELDADGIALAFEAIGASFSAGASKDSAAVSLRTLTDPPLRARALDLLALVLRAPTFPQADLERERDLMRVALRLQQQSPGDLASKAFYRALYPEHPYGQPTDGTEESLAALDRDAVVRFHREHYVARNAIVALVGAVSRKEAEAIAERVVGKLPTGRRAPELAVAPALGAGGELRLPHPSAQSHLLVGQPVMLRTDPDYFPLYVGNHVLGGSGLVSRISDAIREQRGLAYSAYSYFIPMRGRGPLQMGLQTRGDQLAEALEVLKAELVRFREEGPTATELEAAKKNITGGFPLRLDSNRKILDQVVSIAFHGLPLDYLDRFPERVEAVTVEQVRDAFRRRVDPQRLTVVIAGG